MLNDEKDYIASSGHTANLEFPPLPIGSFKALNGGSGAKVYVLLIICFNFRILCMILRFYCYISLIFNYFSFPSIVLSN